jgi:hypothetical protein
MCGPEVAPVRRATGQLGAKLSVGVALGELKRRRGGFHAAGLVGGAGADRMALVRSRRRAAPLVLGFLGLQGPVRLLGVVAHEEIRLRAIGAW